MKTDLPYIHLFKTPGGKYFYDGNRNVILALDDDSYTQLNSLVKKADEVNVPFMDLIREYPGLGQLYAKGFLRTSSIREIVHYSNDNLESYLENKLSTVILQVTQCCNLRCKYCAYSGLYENRTHSASNMEPAIAIAAIDFLYKHSSASEKISITFYGGEPLMRFELIKKAVLYAESKFEGKMLLFEMTTNGTLLSEEVVEFLTEHNIKISLSLDGPEQIHDKNRRFARGNCGTFHTVIERLEMIKRKFPEYLKQISIIAVIDPTSDFNCTIDFFVNYDVVKQFEHNIRASFISDLTISAEGYKRFFGKEEFDHAYNYEIFKKYLTVLGKIDKKYTTPLVNWQYVILQRIQSLLEYSDADIRQIHHGGPCIPGVHRIFVDTQGSFLPCEKVSESCGSMYIGNLTDGFDLARVRQILNIGQLTEAECKHCWAIRFCNLCVKNAGNKNGLSKETKLTHCIRMKNIVDNQFKDYCMFKEMGHSFEDIDLLKSASRETQQSEPAR